MRRLGVMDLRGARERIKREAERRRLLIRMRRVVRPERFGSFGARTVIEPPFRVGCPEGIDIGRDVHVRPNAWFSVHGTRDPDGAPLLSIGDRAQLGSDIVIACMGRVEIGPDVLTADRVFIGDTYHEYRDPARPIHAQGMAPPRPVRIGAGAFLGIGSIVLPGVTIGRNACIGAGAVVTTDIPDHCLAVGNPARVVRHWDPSAGAWVKGAPMGGSLHARSAPVTAAAGEQ
jgi:acetyltransferase-like isoleucine patch superfamily enzyme